MKMWTSPKLVESFDTLVGADDSSEWWFCSSWLRQHFKWPSTVKALWLTLGIQASADRVAVEFKDYGASGILGRERGRQLWELTYSAFKYATFDHFGPRLTSGPLYLGLLYEE